MEKENNKKKRMSVEAWAVYQILGRPNLWIREEIKVTATLTISIKSFSLSPIPSASVCCYPINAKRKEKKNDKHGQK